jgi:hypothetical protein
MKNIDEKVSAGISIIHKCMQIQGILTLGGKRAFKLELKKIPDSSKVLKIILTGLNDQIEAR